MRYDEMSSKATFYNRRGNIISDKIFSNLMEDSKYRTVARSILENGSCVSTIWLGIDHDFYSSDNHPLIFETMVFSNEKDYNSIFCARYATEAEALIGHKKAIKKFGFLKKDVSIYERLTTLLYGKKEK
jgi:hypothetical protein